MSKMPPGDSRKSPGLAHVLHGKMAVHCVIANLISGQSHLEGKFMMISSPSIAIEVCKTKDGLEMSVSFC
jgi:hypothetical protein